MRKHSNNYNRMENRKDIRWHQRFENYKSALAQLTLFMERGNTLNFFEEQGLIKCFEYCYELAWNTVKDLMEEQGETNIKGSRDTIRIALKRKIVTNGEGWMDMLASRIKTVHTYNIATAEQVIYDIRARYYTLFLELQNVLADYKTMNYEFWAE